MATGENFTYVEGVVVCDNCGYRIGWRGPANFDGVSLRLGGTFSTGPIVHCPQPTCDGHFKIAAQSSTEQALLAQVQTRANFWSQGRPPADGRPALRIVQGGES
jgi:hypothetical protein